MSKSEELRYFFKKSLNAPSGIGQRSGETEDGNELGDMLSAGAWDVDEQMIAEEERADRIKFLKQFFAFLKQTLTPEQFKFVKLRYTKRKTDRQIAVWLGYPNAAQVFREIQATLQGKQETIDEIVLRSEWDGAKAFAQALTLGANSLIKEKELIDTLNKSDGGFAAIMRATEQINKSKKAPKQQRVKRRFYMRGFYYGAKFKEETSFEEKAVKKARYALLDVISLVDVVKDIAEEKSKTDTAQELASFCTSWLCKISEALEKIDPSAFVPKEEIDEYAFEQLAKILIAESMNERKSYSARCKEKREIKTNTPIPYLPAMYMPTGQARIASKNQ